jgi:hypothetical protein
MDSKKDYILENCFIILMNTDRAAFGMPAVYMIMRDGQNNF